MPRLNFHVPEDIAEAAKRKAKAAGKSLSSYIADLVMHDVGGEWPEGFFEEVVGGWKGEPLERTDQGAVREARASLIAYRAANPLNRVPPHLRHPRQQHAVLHRLPDEIDGADFEGADFDVVARQA